MHRRTDFYVVTREKQSKMGFPEGIAEKLLVKTFREFPYKEAADVQRAMAQGGPPPGTKQAPKAKGKPKSKTKAPATTTKKAAAAKSSGAAPPAPSAQAAAAAAAPTAAAPAPVPAPKESDVHPLGTGKKMEYNENGKQIPIGNGGVTSDYWWTQSLYETTGGCSGVRPELWR